MTPRKVRCPRCRTVVCPDCGACRNGASCGASTHCVGHTPGTNPEWAAAEATLIANARHHQIINRLARLGVEAHTDPTTHAIQFDYAQVEALLTLAEHRA